MFKRISLFLMPLVLLAQIALAVPTCTITGQVSDGGGNPVVNGTITFNTLFTQVVSGNTINQTLVSTTTDDSGDLVPISLAQGVYVQVTINGGAPVTAIVPFASSVTFAQLLSNVVTNPTLATLTITGQTPAPTCTAGDGTLYFDSTTNQLMLDENCGGYFQVLSATNDFPDCQDSAGQHLNYTASSKTLTCGNTGGGGGPATNPFSDAAALVKNDADNTKLLIISAANITTATTRTLTAPDRNATIGTTTGTLTSGNLAKFDASGNIVDDGISILSLSGNTTKAATVSGSLTSGNFLKSDASGNLVDAGTAGGKTMLSGGSQGLASGSTIYFPAGSFTQGGSSTEANNNTITSLAGTIKNLYCAVSTAPGSAKSFAFTYRKNGASQTLTCTISGSGTTCNDTTHTFTVAAGDLVSIQSNPTGSPTSSTGNCAAELDPS